MLEALIIFMVFSVIACLADDALSPPVLMASKDFHRDSRSEARDAYDVELDAYRVYEFYKKLRLSQLTPADLPVIVGMIREMETLVMEIEMVDGALIDKETARSLYRVKMRLIMRADQLRARYLDLADLNRSEARIRESA